MGKKARALLRRAGLGVVVGFAFWGCGEPTERADAGDGDDAFRVAVARFSHETCTFCPGGDMDVEDWTRIRPPLVGDEVMEEGGSYIGGFARMAREYGDMELIGLTSPYEAFGGSSRAWTTEEAFDHFMEGMLSDLRDAMPVDGVYLSLHGAMAVRGVPRPEAEIARRFREVVGPDVPIVATFDLHGNEDEAFLRHADGSFVTKHFPHYDTWYQGERAATYLRRIMRAEYDPVTVTLGVPIITATVLQWTGASPVMDVMARARRWEDQYPDLFVNVFLGFPWSDVPDVGATVQAMANGDSTLARRAAEDVASLLWRVRERYASGDFPLPEEAVARTREAIRAGATPVVLADYWDRPGDGTWTLAELVRQGVGGVLYAALTDAPALDAIWKEDLQPGDPFDREVGGYTGEQAGEPVRITGTLRWRGERWGYERVAAIDWGDGNVLVLTPAYQQVMVPEALRFADIEPDDFDVFVLKTRAHFRRGFDDTGYAPTIMLVDAPGDWFGTTRLGALSYEHAPIERLYPFGSPAATGPRPPGER
ncbi:MAG: M81 family metallopeptidase [Gemmatimonadota bacterium]